MPNSTMGHYVGAWDGQLQRLVRRRVDAKGARAFSGVASRPGALVQMADVVDSQEGRFAGQAAST
jgi:hypothetical protein